MVSGEVLVCPQCSQNDQIRKVSSVVSGGTSRTEDQLWIRGGIPQQYAPIKSETGLAARLRMIPRPDAETDVSASITVGCVGAVGLFIGAAIIAAIAKSGGLFNAFVLFIILGWIVWVVHVFAQRLKANELIATEWQSMLQFWHELYYCYRDDIVFYEGDPTKHATASDMSNLLFRRLNGE